MPLSVAPGAMDETFRLASGAAFAHLEPRVLSSDPWVLQFDAFLSEEEAAARVGVRATARVRVRVWVSLLGSAS